MDAQTTQTPEQMSAQRAPTLFNIVEQAIRQIAGDEVNKHLTGEAVALALHNQLQPLVTAALKDSVPQIKDLVQESLTEYMDREIERRVERLSMDDVIDHRDFKDRVESIIEDADDVFTDKISEAVGRLEFKVTVE